MKKNRDTIEAPVGWADYFFGLMHAVARKSKDPNTKVGAVLVNAEKTVIGVGYNGFPSGFLDSKERWERPKKYDYVVHAEVNAVLRSTQRVKGASLYVPCWPCKDCAKIIAAAEIKEVHIKSSHYDNEISREIFAECGVAVVCYY
jgi:dCMP deaminase